MGIRRMSRPVPSVIMTLMLLMIIMPGDSASAPDFAGAALKAGTAGVGADVTLGLSDNINLRVGLNYFSHTHESFDNGEKDLIGKLNLQTAPLLADWHPSAGNFRVSAGLFINNNRLSLDAVPGAEIDFNDVEYRVESFSGNMSFNRLSPYIGIGYGNAARGGSRFGFSFDFGVMFHGTPKISAEAVAADPGRQEALERDLDAELNNLRDDADPFKFYPVLSFGALYRF